MATTIVHNVGLQRRRPNGRGRKQFEFKNVQFEAPADVEGPALRALIHAAHPGWTVTGHCHAVEAR